MTFRCIASLLYNETFRLSTPAIPPQERERPYETCADTVRLVVTLDPVVGDFRNGELLFSGNRIEAAGRNLGATADETIDAGDKIVMPGLVNAHMHTWETALRGIGAEWMTADISATCTSIWRRAIVQRTTISAT